ncbi:MAG TPA: YdcF family protein [Phycisphaerae bacterium]|nr:YdcF family protein [Phycisphaerae bacterium]
MTNKNSPESAPPPPPPVRPRRRWLRWIEHALALIGGGLLLMVFTPATQWLYDALDRQTALAKSKYVICLGGDPARVIEACRLLNEGYGENLILSNHGENTDRMRDLALEWGAPADRILLDHRSQKTSDHAPAIRDGLHVDPANDLCIVVTSYTHLARSKACFEKAGYRHLILREPRWERQFRAAGGWKYRFRVLPTVVYEYAAWLEYYVRGAV